MTATEALPLRVVEQDTRPALRVGMRFDSPANIPESVPAAALLLSNNEEGWTADQARYDTWGYGAYLWPMTLLYLPRYYRGPVAAPSSPADGTESDAGVVVPELTHQRGSGSTQYIPVQGWVDDCVDCQTPWPCPTVAGVMVADASPPTQAGYRAEVEALAARDRAMANHPAGKGRK